MSHNKHHNHTAPTSDGRDPRQLLASRELSASAAAELQAAADVSSAKLAHYAQGPARKTKHEKEKEAALAKERQAEEEAAAAYESFVASFGVDDDEEPGASGGGGGGRGRSAGKGFVRAGGGEGYNPLKDQQKMQQQQPQIPTGPKADRPRASALMEEDEPEPIKKPMGKKRNMDNFLEELKRDQKEREDRLKHQAGRTGSSVTALAAREHAPVLTGSYDSGDPLTTNIHVAPLPQNVTEQSLGNFFARYGPVGSVKIMWPRLDAGPVPGGRRILGGFVAFLRRPDAEKAAKDLDGAEWGGSVLRTSWGKAVPLPVRPIYEVEGASSRSDRDRDRSSRRRDSGSRSRSRSREPEDYLRKRRRSSYSPSSSSRDRSSQRNWPTLEAGADERFLKSTSEKVRHHGRPFEDMLKDRERNNPKFAFLSDEKLPSYHYFRMLVDSSYQPPSGTTFVDEGTAEIYSSDSAEDSERERVPKGKLGKLARRRFESLLRSITSTRDKIARGMVFALEHADAASLIVDLLVASLTLEATPVPRKIARLHLVSDILHNSSASLPNAWVYRSIFESRLPVVFDHLGEIYLSFPGRMKAEQFRLQVTNIVDVWERDWIIFEPGVIEDLKQRLSGTTATPEAPSRESSTPVASTSSAPVASTSAPRPSESASPVAVAPRPGFKSGGFKTTFMPSALNDKLPDPVVEDVDGEGIDLDGESAEDVDGEAMDDVDGEALEEEDVDGSPMLEEDVDGEEVPAPAAPATEVVVLDDDDDGEAMVLGDSDDDMF